jgi:hypothetical protein
MLRSFISSCLGSIIIYLTTTGLTPQQLAPI